ncbi:MAG: glycosyltransferase [Flavobacteriales bacterium]|nr:glycosyltransferase [Flavobacteriales bacterium]
MKVAVVIPCFNVAHHVEAAVRSVWAQTHTDIDLVAVDDGSTDDTLEVLRRLEQERPDALRVLSVPNGGACAARNEGLRATQGAYVQFLDADDTLVPEKIAGQVALCANGPDLIVGGFADRIGTNVTREVMPPGESAWMALIRTRLGTTSANLWKREALERAGGWNEDLASSQDYELAFRVLKAGGQVSWDMRIVAHILKRSEGSISRTDEVGNWRRYIDLRVAVREHLQALDAVRYKAEIGEVDQYLFRAIRMIGRNGPVEARELHGRIMPKGFVPLPGEALSASYALLYRWFGFRTAEVAAGALGNLRRLSGKR